jgi:hypothetical protein
MNAETSAWGRAISAVLGTSTKRIATVNEIPNQKRSVSDLEDFIASAHLAYEKADLEALRGIYKRAKGTRGISPDLLQQIADLASGLKK